MHKYFLFYIILLYSLGMHAQKTEHADVSHFTVTDGLASGNVHRITEDKQGFIWIATENGLSRYDQYTCTNFEENTIFPYGLAHNFVFDVVPHQKHGVWVGTISGLNKYNVGSGKFTHYYFYSKNAEKLYKPVNQIVPLASGSCFLRTNEHTIYMYSHTQDSIVELSYSGYQPLAQPTFIYPKDSASVLVGDKNGHLYSLNANGKAHIIDSLSHAISCILTLDTTSFLVADISGTIHIYKQNKKQKSYIFPLQYHTQSEKYISSLRKTNKDTIYVGTQGAGIFSFSPKSGWLNEAIPTQSLINGSISDIFIDSRKSMWIGHSYGGISIIPPKKAITYLNLPETIQKNTISAIASYKNTLWIGTENDGLYIYNTKTHSFNQFNAHMRLLGADFDNQITALHFDGSQMWIGTYNKGVFAVSLPDYSLAYYSELQKIPTQDISALYSSKNNTVWIGTYGKGVYVFSKKSRKIIRHYSTTAPEHSRISTDGITCLFEDSQQNMWIGGYYGISKVAPDKSITIFAHNTHKGLQNNVITGVQEDNNNTIWISTLHGISTYLHVQDSIYPFISELSEFNHAIASIFPVNAENIACITLKNMYIYNTKHNITKYIGSCPFGEFSKNTFIYNHSHSLLLGTQKGIVQAKIDTNFSSTKSGSIALTDLLIDGISIFSKETKYTAQYDEGTYSLNLPYYEENISVEITDFSQNSNIESTYEYTLKGFDKKWHTLSKNNTIQYTNLPGGNYTLRVKKKLTEGVSDYELQVQINIHKALWETTLFYIILAIILIVLFYSIYSAQVHKIIITRNKLQKQVESRTKDLLKQKEQILEQKERIQKQRDEAHKKNAEMSHLAEQHQELESTVQQMKFDLEKTENENSTLHSEYKKILKQYNTIIHFSKEMIFRIALPSENFEYISPACEKITGYTPAEFYTDKNIFKNLFVTKDKDKFKKFRKYMIEGKVPPLMEYKIKTKDGSSKWVAQHSIIIRDEDKKPIAYEAMVVDISDLKKIQRQKEASIQRKKDVESLQSHINNESTSDNTFKLFSEILNKPGISLDEKQAFLEVENENTTSLQMIDDIIDIYKIESGELHLNNSQCYVNTLLQDLYESFTTLKNKNKKKHLLLNLDIPIEEENFSFYTDTYRLRQILMNLLGNAFKFTSQGSIRFGYTLTNNPTGEYDKEIVFFVQDTGIGISEKQMPFIFERFKSHDGKFGFNGVGLYLSHKLVDLLGGKMWVESVVNTGTIFHFSLPIEKMKGLKKTDLSSQYTEDIGDIDWSHKTLLLAEDEQDNYDYVKEILKRTKMSVIWVRNGEEAINTYQENQREIDIILMDIQMPKINGYEATQRIKEMNPNIPIIAQTAYANSEAKINCFDAGCDHYLAKPYRARDLIETIGKHL
ncbi:MAG: two-component regulator propeller domain-containing protein [Bacteroidota bacterium]